MKVSLSLVALSVLLLQALPINGQSESLSCACENGAGRYQLLRGEDQVKQCKAGLFCHCAQKTVMACTNVFGISWKLNEKEGICDLYFDCEKFFNEQPATTTTTTTTTTTPKPTTTTTTTTTPKPTTTTTTTTTPKPTTPRPTMAPTTAAPTTTSKPVEDGKCVCSSSSVAQQIIRGEDEVKSCKDGLYCNCANGEVKKCWNFWGQGWRFDEASQSCVFNFDCESFLGSFSN